MASRTSAQPGAEADGVRAERGRGVVLQLIVILGVANCALVVAAAGKCALHGDGGRGEKRKLVVAIANVLKARFIDYLGLEYLRVAELQRVLLVQGVIALRLQGELGDSVVGALLPVVHVTER